MSNPYVFNLLKRLGRPGVFVQYQDTATVYRPSEGRAERNVAYTAECTVYVLKLMKTQRPGGLQQQDGNNTEAVLVFNDPQAVITEPNTNSQLTVDGETWDVSSVHPQYVAHDIAYYKLGLQ